MKKYLLALLVLIASFSALSCTNTTTAGNEAIDVTLLMTGYVNLGTDQNDPYRQWIQENYGLNVTLNATSDFSGQAIIAFASNNKPDIVVFDSIDQYNTIDDQGVLLEDWTPYLEQMPNIKSIVEKSDDDSTGDSIGRQMMTSVDGKLGGVWTVPDSPTWSLKIREDWAAEYRATTVAGSNYPAGNVATNGGAWQPDSPQDLLSFARWIKATKEGCYAFTSAGGGSSLGTLGNWLPLMWGSVAELPYGAYVNSEGNVGFSVTDGTHRLFLNFLKTIVDEGLIDPNWYVQSWSQKTKTQQGLIGIEWYPGAISTETESYNEKKDGSTVNWWKSYDLPVASGYESTGGFLPVEGYVGKIICVSKKAAMNTEKMTRICALLNDIAVHYDAETDSYVRPVAYDALRWGVGVETGLEFTAIDGTDYVYLNTKSANGSYYRESTAGAGAWDWGAWIATTHDGVIQGTSGTIDAISLKVIEHTEKTAGMKMKIQIGSALSELDASRLAELKAKQINYEYNFVTGENVDSYDTFYTKWTTIWGGNELLTAVADEFRDYGLMD